MFLGESFPQGNYVGDKSSERHSGAISWGKLSGGNYLRDNFPGAIIQGAIIWGQLSGGQFSLGQLSGGKSSGGAIVRTPDQIMSLLRGFYVNYIALALT